MSIKDQFQKKLNLRNQQFKVLQKITEVVSSARDLEEILDEIIKLVRQITKADSCFLYLMNPEKKELVLRASQNPHLKDLGRVTLKLGEGITGWTAKEKRSAAISQKAYADPRFKSFPVLSEDRFEAFLAVPIIFKDKVVGAINVQHKKSKKHSREEIGLIQMIGQQVGGAIENARLLTEVEVLKENLEIRKLVEKAKGILMKEFNLSEEGAYRLIHKKAMDSRKSMRQIAEAVLLSNDLKIKR